MRRRDFIQGIAGLLTAWPLDARAQPGKLPIIGFLGTSAASSWSAWTAAFEQRLGDLGWTQGRTVAIEYRWGGKDTPSVLPRSRPSSLKSGPMSSSRQDLRCPRSSGQHP